MWTVCPTQIFCPLFFLHASFTPYPFPPFPDWFQNPHASGIDPDLCTVVEAPTLRTGHTATLVGTNLFVIGGRKDGDGMISSDIYVFDLLSGVWFAVASTGPVAFQARTGHTTTLVDNRLVVWLCRFSLAWRCDPGWNAKCVTPPIFSFPIRTTAMQVFGGLGSSGPSSDVYLLDIQYMRWTLWTDGAGAWPSPRVGHTAVTMDGNSVTVFGGEGAEEDAADVWRLVRASKCWRPA